MTVPTGYTASTLADYMIVRLSKVATVLGWTASTAEIVEAVNSVLFALEQTNIAVFTSTTDLRRLRAAAAVEAWRAAVEATAAYYTHQSGQFSYTRSDLQKMALEGLARAEAEAASAGALPGWVVKIRPTVAQSDPYSPGTSLVAEV